MEVVAELLSPSLLLGRIFFLVLLQTHQLRSQPLTKRVLYLLVPLLLLRRH